MKLFFYFTISLGFLVSGCAGVKLYKEESFDNRTGLKFYYPKPYLLVERNAAKDVPLKTTIIYLPDLANPVYAKVINGFGANEFSLALSNGALSTYGIKTDSKIPETIASAGGVLTGVGGVLSGVGTIKTAAAGDVQQSASSDDLEKVQKIVDLVKKDLVDAPPPIPDFITSIQKDKLKSATDEIQNTLRLIAPLNPLKTKDIIQSIDKVIASLNEIQCQQEFDECKRFNERFKNFVDQLSKAKMIIAPADTSKDPSFELYEIIADKNGTLTYRLVKSTS